MFGIVLLIILCVSLIAFTGYQVYLLVKQIKERKIKKGGNKE